MKTGVLVLALAAATSGQAAAQSSESGNTTVVRTENSIAVVTQSGDPSKSVVHVEKQPGRTFIYRQSGGNTSIVTQSSDPADVPSPHLPPWMQE
jgi:hypothetical protein